MHLAVQAARRIAEMKRQRDRDDANEEPSDNPRRATAAKLHHDAGSPNLQAHPQKSLGLHYRN